MNHPALVVAILRGIQPGEIDAVADALMESGIRIIEVPLNSPDACTSIARLRARCSADCVIGAGTVLDSAAVDAVHRAGAEFIVSPNTNTDVIRHALALGMGVMPGFMTPTEAFAAVGAGATLIKLFPAAGLGPGHAAALRSVLPPEVQIIAVGGIGAGNVGQWSQCGIAGIGVGGELYRPGTGADEVRKRAREVVVATGAALPATKERLIDRLRLRPVDSAVARSP